jgi:hypothetical protein
MVLFYWVHKVTELGFTVGRWCGVVEDMVAVMMVYECMLARCSLASINSGSTNKCRNKERMGEENEDHDLCIVHTDERMRDGYAFA